MSSNQKPHLSYYVHVALGANTYNAAYIIAVLRCTQVSSRILSCTRYHSTYQLATRTAASLPTYLALTRSLSCPSSQPPIFSTLYFFVIVQSLIYLDRHPGSYSDVTCFASIIPTHIEDERTLARFDFQLIAWCYLGVALRSSISSFLFLRERITHNTFRAWPRVAPICRPRLSCLSGRPYLLEASFPSGRHDQTCLKVIFL